jgi:L-gulonolactone oxidase
MATTATRRAATKTAGAWTNWAGDQTCRPAEIVAPRSRGQLAEAVSRVAEDGGTVHVAGSGHSFTEAALTDGTMLRLEALDRVLDADRESGLVRVEAGISLSRLNDQLWSLGLALENLGDIDTQTLAGAISTGTHGTGARLRNISAQVEAIELVTADGSVRELSADAQPDLLRAARVGLGALGAISAVTLRCVPAFVLDRVDAPRPTDEVLDTFQERAEQHDHYEFFTFPYADTALVLERNRSDEAPRPRGRAAAFVNDIVLENWALDVLSRSGRRFPGSIPRLARFAAKLASGSHAVDRSYRIFANERRVRFTEMEYGVPRENGPEAARRVIDWVRSNSYPVFFPIEMRVVAGDDALISPSHERDTAYIAVHQYHGMEWRPYFEAVESIMNEYGGRPHWGKRHFQTHATLPGRYPRWADFLAARDELDPQRVFRNPYTERVLGD